MSSWSAQCIGSHDKWCFPRTVLTSPSFHPLFPLVPAQLAIILISVGTVLALCVATCCCFYCGLCKCLNNAKDDSKFGLCNRFCPWMPCSEPPDPDAAQPDWMHNPGTEEENKSSLFGRNPMLNAVSG